MRRNRTLGALAVSAAVVGFGSAAQATILPFAGGTTAIGNGTVMSTVTGYGDNVDSTTEGGFTFTVGAEGWTPNVTASFGDRTAKYTNAALGGTAVYAKDNTGSADTDKIRVVLTADAGYEVVLYDMAVAAAGTNRTADSIKVNDGTSDLYVADGSQNSSARIALNGTSSTVTFGPVQGAVLTLVIDLTTDSSTDYYMSNLRFGQTAIPEPASLGLVGLGALGLLARRRRA